MLIFVISIFLILILKIDNQKDNDIIYFIIMDTDDVKYSKITRFDLVNKFLFLINQNKHKLKYIILLIIIVLGFRRIKMGINRFILTVKYLDSIFTTYLIKDDFYLLRM